MPTLEERRRTMPKFRKKPVVIEAVRWRGGEQIPPAPSHLLRRAWLSGRWELSTLEGWYKLTPGDWIIRGVKGEYYPCKPDIFAATYERVEEQP